MTDTAQAATDVRYEQVDLRVGGVGLTVAAAGRDGDLAPVVFLHGFGSTKEDYLDIACQRAFTGHPFLAYDAPGCGETFCEDLPGISIPFLVKTAQALLDHAGIRRFHLVGHSMGGLTALMLAYQEPDRVLSFTDIEGNLAPEDCFLSRQILTHPSDDDGFLDDFVERTRRSRSSSSALFAANLRHKVRPGAVRGIFQSMVDLSDQDDLMPKFLDICPARACSCSAKRTPHCRTWRNWPQAVWSSQRSRTAGTGRCTPTRSRCGNGSPHSSTMPSALSSIRRRWQRARGRRDRAPAFLFAVQAVLDGDAAGG